MGSIRPITLRSAIRAELGRAFTPPYEALFVVAGNGLLMTGAWFVLPPNLFFRWHGALAFPMILASWMYSDVPATNVVGSDPWRSIAALDQGNLRRLLYAKNLMLWLLIVPVCVPVAIGIGIYDKRFPAAMLSIVWIAIVPLGALGVAAWAGILFPYHPIALRYRWDQRRAWKPMILRWVVLILLPYGLVPLLTVAVSTPTLLYWYLVTKNEARSLIPDSVFAWGAALACAISIAVWIVGHRVGVGLAERRKAELTAFLADPDLG